MPQYDFRCLDCKKRFRVFLTFAEYGVKPVACTHCGSQNVQRRIGRVRVAKGSESIGRVRVAKGSESRLAAMADPALLDKVDENPRALGRMMRELSHETDEEMSAEFDEVVDRLEKGQSPEDIDRELPDFGDEE